MHVLMVFLIRKGKGGGKGEIVLEMLEDVIEASVFPCDPAQCYLILFYVTFKG